MDIILTVDRGNTFTKLALWGLEQTEPYAAHILLDTEHAYEGQQTISGQLEESIGHNRLLGTAYCNVGSQTDGQLMAMLRGLGGQFVEVTSATPMELGMGYATPQTLGTDRLVAATAAYSLSHYYKGEILVVDIGTAITYDLVNNGIYTGGNIAAGIDMRLRALHEFTARLPLVTPESITPLWGNTTTSALSSGAVMGVVGELEFYIHHLQQGAKVYVTGGQAQLILQHLDNKATVSYQPHLVGLGLRQIFLCNTTNTTGHTKAPAYQQ